MRRSLAGVATAVTCLVAVAFLVPLMLLVGSVVRDRAMAEAFRTAAGIGPVLAVTTEADAVRQVLSGWPAPQARRASVYLPPGTRSGAGPDGTGEVGNGTAVGGLVTLVGPAAAPRAQVAAAMRSGLPATVPLPDGAAALQPVALPSGRIAVVEVDVPGSVLDRGVQRARVLLAGLALALVAGSVLVADRLGARVVRSAGALAAAAGRLGSGDLGVRVRPDGPVELREAAGAFNAMTDRITALLAAERELAADLSHRLRTPLAGLVLAGRSLGPGLPGDQIRALTERLQQEVDAIIRDARGGRTSTPRADGAGPGAAAAGTGPGPGADRGEPLVGRCEAGAVLRERLDFWGALAEDQGRRWRLVVPPEPVWVPVPARELATAVDALVGNVFLHTGAGVGFTVRLVVTRTGTRLVVADEGEGIVDPAAAVRRGASTAGSSGLGLDIVGRVATGCGGRLLIGRSAAGGAEVCLEFPHPDAFAV